MVTFVHKEQELTLELKNICNEDGEIYPQQSAEILNKLGLLYKTKSPDKISLIQSATLFNAAICRKPSDQKLKKNLQKFCKHILFCANAKLKDADLIKISADVKHQVDEMRRKVSNRLKQIKFIPDNLDESTKIKMEEEKIHKVQSLQTDLSDDYTKIMASISNNCLRILGKPPCKFSVVAMGSLARDEATPYSDFEHVIVLEDSILKKKNIDKIKEYFRWYSVIFHVIIINLQETILPSVCIPGLNDYSKSGGDWFYDNFTPRGISFDGLMPHASKLPLGRTKPTENKPWTTELIKPVSEMVKYLETEEDLKNGYKLADILTRTSFVYGDETVYNLFCDKVKICLSKNKLSSHSTLVAQLNEDLQNFDAFKNITNLGFKKSFNIKRIIYRSTTLFISALGRLFNLDCNSNFEIIKELEFRGYIDEETTHKLLLAVATGCHMRLDYYMLKKRQDDSVENKKNLFTRIEATQLLRTVSNQSLVEYFLTSFYLQFVMKNNLPIKELNTLLKHPEIDVILCVMCELRLFSEAIAKGEANLKGKEIKTIKDVEAHISLGFAYQIKGQFEQQFKLMEKIKKSPVVLDANMKWFVELQMIYKYFFVEKSYTKVIYEIDRIIISFKPQDELCIDCLYLQGSAYFELADFYKALNSFRDLKNYFDSIDDDIYMKSISCITLARINASACLSQTGKPEQALNWTFEALELLDQHDSDILNKCNCFRIISYCYQMLNCHKQSERYYNIAKFHSL